jgi:predicted component of type VI protein secretion system
VGAEGRVHGRADSMNQQQKELHSLLRQLHEELARAGNIDEESRQLLGVVAGDIGALTASRQAAVEHLPALKRLAVDFESEHPSLAATARQIADLLAKAGI